MAHIVLTEEQIHCLPEVGGQVDVHHPDGHLVATLTLLTPQDLEDIANAKRAIAAGGPRASAEQRQAHFRRLEAIRTTEGLDTAKALDLLRQMRAGERV
jgi:hypothetical protein